MHIQVNDHVSLSAPHEGDLETFVNCLKDREIHERTMQIPSPYTMEDARAFLESVGERSHKFGRLMDWAIRWDDEKLIGMISFQGTPAFAKGSDEIGFWLAKPYWDRGIMTETLMIFSILAFETYRMKQLEAGIFSSNKSSIRVVEKCGFTWSKKIPNAYLKNGEPVDAEFYILCKNP